MTNLHQASVFYHVKGIAGSNFYTIARLLSEHSRMLSFFNWQFVRPPLFVVEEFCLCHWLKLMMKSVVSFMYCSYPFNNVFVCLLNSEKLRERVHDVDEGVRQEVVAAIAKAAKKDITNISDEMLTLIKDRTLDKKVSLGFILLHFKGFG